mgnify:CR=1 FL=1
MEQFIDNLILSLNSIEVKGEDNLNVLLGCILAVKKLKAELNKPKETGEDEDNG